MNDQNSYNNPLTNNESSCCSQTSCCQPPSPVKREAPKVGRNDPCPCGNGRKFKKCCGQYL
ncbi:MAG: SEC-C domain-containing protein [Oleispira sp.]|nr:SEC-C domain-containing protein [Oleispira sp.]